MNPNWKKTLVAAGLAGLAVTPFIAKADGFNFNVKIGDDNEAHYRFRDRGIPHDPEMLRAARALAEAKNHLWYAKNDFGGHRANAVRNINMALDEIRAAEAHRGYDREDRQDDGQ
jgi:hypothetical protein